MAKQSGLGSGLLVAGVDLSGDAGSFNPHGGPTLIDVTGINKSGFERIGGLLDGGLEYTAFFNPSVGAAHPTLATLPTADRIVTAFLSSTLGDEAACIVGKQTDYSGNRGADGSFTFSVPGPANGFGLEWANTLTAGKRTDTAATNGASLDGTAASTTGWAAYLHVTALTGTNVVVTLEDSADNVSFAAFTGSAFTSVTSAPGSERIAGASGATVRRYVRAVTTGTFTSATFLVAFTRHPSGASS